MGRDIDPRLSGMDERERANFELLRSRLKSSSISPEALGQALPEAVLISAGADQRLPKSMVETTEQAIELSIEKDPAVLSTALFPIIGSAIRKAVDRLVSETLSRLNEGLENTLSFQRAAWRMEARRSHLPYIEVVLQHTLEYRVECAFLIHRKTGLLLTSLSRPDSKLADRDMVASMLTAVQDYIRDSLTLGRAEAVESLQAGDYTILTEAGPQALLAVVVRGAPDPALRGLLRDVLESSQLKFAKPLAVFRGDTAAFEEGKDILKPCLASREKGEGKKKKPVFALVFLGLLAAACVVLIVIGSVAAGRRRAFITALDAEPGIVVLGTRRAKGRTELRLLRDPRSRTPESLAAGRPIQIEDYSFAVEGYVASDLRSLPADLSALADRLSSLRILFDRDSGRMIPGQDALVAEFGSLARSIVARAEESGWEPRIEVVGHAAGSASDSESERVSAERAAWAYTLLTKADLALAPYLAARGAGAAEPLASEATEEGRAQNRSVSFSASFR